MLLLKPKRVRDKGKDTERSRRWRAKNPDKYAAHLARNKERYYADIEASRAKARINNNSRCQEKIRAANRKQRESNPERVRRRDRERRLRNCERDWAKKLLGMARHRSKRRGHCAPSITEDGLNLLWQRQGGLCYWTGIEMTRVHGRLTTASIDRLDNGAGYDPSNVVLCTKAANLARGDASVDAFEAFLSAIRYAGI